MEIQYKRGMFIVVENTVWRVVGINGIITADRPRWNMDDFEVEHFEKKDIRPYFLQPDDKITFRGGISTIMHSLGITDYEEIMLHIMTNKTVKKLPTNSITILGHLTIVTDDNT